MTFRTCPVLFTLSFLLIVGPPGGAALHSQSIDSWSIPDEIRSCMKSKPGLQLDASINPYYISGEFDGDRLTDFAVLVGEPKDSGPGIHHILFCFGSGRIVQWDAGTLAGTANSPFTGWFLVRKQSKFLLVHPRIKNDALAILVGEEGGGLIYWNGRKLFWQPEE
jgi:hypothetical protein